MNIEYVVIAGILILSSYFWGKIINKYFDVLHKVNTTLFGMLIIFALFECFVFFGIKLNFLTNYYLYWLLCIVGISPILCLILRVNVLPTINDLFAGLFSVAVTVGLCYLSSKMNTNNIFFDSVFYMSRVIDSSASNHLGYLSSFSGKVLNHIESLYDYQGYYYFWGMVLRQYNIWYPSAVSLTPMYIWTATMIYGMCLGNLIAMSIQTLLSDNKWRNIIFSALIVLFLAPYYVNYFNSTLGFFGNTIKTVAVGAAVYVCYLFLKNPKKRYMILLGIVYLAGLSFSSSCFFQFAFISVALFFAMLLNRQIKPDDYYSFFIGSATLLPYLYVLGTDTYNMNQPRLTLYAIVAYTVITISSLFWNRFSEKVYKVVKIVFIVLFGLLLAGMIWFSYLYSTGDMGYSFFFEKRSADDMILNYVSWTDEYELYRNIILYVLLTISLLRFKRDKEFKILLVALIVLFINPLVCPVIANFATDIAYVRVFDLIVNPFTLVFICVELLTLTKWLWAGIVIVAVASLADGYLAYHTMITPFNPLLYKNQVGYDWKNKVTKDQWDVYTYLNMNVSDIYSDLYRATLLTSDPSTKAYVANLQLVYSAIDVRNTVNQVDDFDISDVVNKSIVYFNPLAVDAQEEYNGYLPDFQRLPELIKETGANYVVMRVPMAVYDPKGYYIEAYKYAVPEVCEVIYQNDTYVILHVK